MMPQVRNSTSDVEICFMSVWGERGVEWLAIANQNDADFGVFTKKCFVKYRENGLLFCGFCIII